MRPSPAAAALAQLADSPAPRPRGGAYGATHTVEVTFDGEKLSSVVNEYADLTLYRTDEGGYFVHLDARKSGDNAVLEVGDNPRGFSEHDIQMLWPELLEAQRRQ